MRACTSLTPERSEPRHDARSRIPELDGIRGIAILLVLADHFGNSSCPWMPLRQIVSFGWAGVDLFFVLSGYLITGILLKSVRFPAYFRDFYMRRAFRIFPVYYVFLILFFHVGRLLSRIPMLSFLARGPGLSGHYGVEEQFYLLLPLVVRYSS